MIWYHTTERIAAPVEKGKQKWCFGTETTSRRGSGGTMVY